jgi:hypothetical protein
LWPAKYHRCKIFDDFPRPCVVFWKAAIQPVHIWKILILELTFAALLGQVSFLTYIPPAKLPALSSDLTETTIVDDLKIDISISPGRIGQNTFVLRLASNGEPVRTAKEVLLRFTPDQANIPPSELELISQGDGTFQAKGTSSVPGNGRKGVVRREKFDALRTQLSFETGHKCHRS